MWSGWRGTTQPTAIEAAFAKAKLADMRLRDQHETDLERVRRVSRMFVERRARKKRTKVERIYPEGYRPLGDIAKRTDCGRVALYYFCNWYFAEVGRSLHDMKAWGAHFETIQQERCLQKSWAPWGDA